MKRMIARATLTVVAVAAGAPSLWAADNCAPSGDVQFLCGPANAEDLIQLGDTGWLIASGMAGQGAPGSLYLIDSGKKSWEAMFPGASPDLRQDAAMFAACPGPLDTRNFSPHGLAIQPTSGGTHRLYITSHGAREAIEVFEIDAAGSKPAIAWIGCVVLPEKVWANSVTILPDGGFLATKMFDPSDPQSLAAVREGRVSGQVYEWHPGEGFSVVPNTELSGPNGIAVSEDGKWLFVAAWGAREVVRLARDGSGAKPDAVKLDFMPDNLRWAPDGRLLVAGQRASTGAAADCGPTPCPAGWVVLKVDPQTLATQEIASDDGKSPLQGTSAALQVGNEVWLGTFRGDRIGYLRLP